MELFVTIFNSFYSLTVVTKSSILDVTGALDPTLFKDSLKPILPSYRNGQSILMTEKMTGCGRKMRQEYIDFK